MREGNMQVNRRVGYMYPRNSSIKTANASGATAIFNEVHTKFA
jgi:hypothetical protein